MLAPMGTIMGPSEPGTEGAVGPTVGVGLGWGCDWRLKLLSCPVVSSAPLVMPWGVWGNEGPGSPEDAVASLDWGHLVSEQGTRDLMEVGEVLS